MGRHSSHRHGPVPSNGPTFRLERPQVAQVCSTPPMTPELTAPSKCHEGFDMPLEPCDELDLASGFRSPSPVCRRSRFSRSFDVGSRRSMSTFSCDTQCSSSAGSLLSSVSTEASDTTLIARNCQSRGPSPLGRGATKTPDDSTTPPFVCLRPQCQQAFTSDEELESHFKDAHPHSCNWAGCHQPSFSTRDGLIWHVNVEHLLACPSPGCTESSFQSSRLLQLHITLAHPDAGENDANEWQLPAQATDMKSEEDSPLSRPQATGPTAVPQPTAMRLGKRKERDETSEEHQVLVKTKYECQDRLRNVLEKRAKKNASTPRSADSPTDLVRGRASRLVETASFPLVFEHAILPFLSAYLPRWVGPRHVVSVSRGKTPQMKRICIMAPQAISRARRIIIASHVQDLIPTNFSNLVTFVFTRGQVNRVTWARGLSKDHKDDICAARNPYFFHDPRMGDSIGVKGNGLFDDSTATLGPCLTVGGGSYWLGNFHPFIDAYRQLAQVHVEHPSSQDRKRCVSEGHDAMAQGTDFRLGRLEVTSGLNLKTTRISHDAYWEDCDMDKPLVVTDWALIAARTSQANILRRFPCETQPLLREPVVNSTAAIVPGANVLSSGRTSGYQRGQICEIPAYVTGDENGTQKATREWFIEEPYPYDSEEEWIRGGIGVSGDSGAAVVDTSNSGLVGQVWGRNQYWGPGPRHTYFTPIADIFDDVQEKCGQQTRPQLPQQRDEADCFPLYPSCRQCYDLWTYLDSRRSSRISLQSMIMGTSDGDQDLTSIEAVSELATPMDYHRYSGVEEAGSSFNSIVSPAAQLLGYSPGSTPMIADVRSPYAATLDLEDLYEPGFRKRGASSALVADPDRPELRRLKRRKAEA